MRSRVLTAGIVGVVTVCVGLAWAPLPAGTDANGFFDEYLTAIGYKTTGCNPGAALRAADYLCDGVVSETTILPEAGLVLLPPVFDPADCTGDDPAVVGLNAALDGFDENALLDVDLNLPITVQATNGNFLDLNALSNGAGNAMAYAWVYVNNKTGGLLTLSMGIGSDDSLQVEINRAQVFDIGVCRGSGGAGTVQNRFPVAFAPGWNLVQFKVFQGGGGWNFRARLEDPADCLNPVQSGGDMIDVDVVLPAGEDIPEPTGVSRTISAAGQAPGQVTADITVSVGNGGQPYSLEETFDPGWSVSNTIPVATQVGAGFVRWNNITAATVSYRLTRSGEWAESQSGVSGAVTDAEGVWLVFGDDAIAGGLPEYIGEVLLTAALDIGEGLGPDDLLHGCNITATEIEGGWISGEDGNGDPVSDADITPGEGMIIRPEWSDALTVGASQSFGLDQQVIGFNGEGFWETPGDPLGGMVLQRVTSGNGFYNVQRGNIYGVDVQDCMCIGFFYVTNPDASAKEVVIAFGSDDAGAVRVNGCPTFSIPACRGDPGWGNADRFKATLRPGKNLIQCYAFDNGGGFNFRVRLEDETFVPIPMGGSELTLSLDPAGYTGPDDPCPDPSPKLFLYVPEVLVTAAFQMQNFQGCDVTADAINGDWLTNAAGTVTDANIVPAEGMLVLPDYGGNAPNISGLDTDAAATAATFWEDELDESSGSLLVRVASTNNAGLYNWQAGTIYNSDPNQSMNVAFFYVISEEDQCVQIAFGSDDSGGVRVNGRPTYAVPACRGVPAFDAADRFVAWLDQGKNLISCLAFDNGGGFGMRVRFEDPATDNPIPLVTTLDPAGYDPADHGPPPANCIPAGPPAYVRSGGALGIVTQYLVPRLPFDQVDGANTIANAIPEDYVSQQGGPPDPDEIFAGAIVEPGTSGLVTTGVRGAGACGFTTLVKFNGFLDGDGAADPGDFDGEAFYGNPDNYSSTLFFHVTNKTNGDLDAWFGFASDDAASLFVNGGLVAEHLTGRGRGGNNVLQTFAAQPATLEPGDNLVQLSYTEGGGGSGARVGMFTNECFDEAFSKAEVEVSASPPGFEEPTVSVTRTIDQLDCDGNGSVTLTVSIAGGGSEVVDVSEELPQDTSGSNPSRGNFNGAGTILSFSGQLNDGDTITYEISGLPGGVFCSSTANGVAIGGDNLLSEGSAVCDFDGEIYVNCGGAEVTDDQGRVWLADTLAQPSKHLTSANANAATWPACVGVLDVLSDQYVAANLDVSNTDVFTSERWNAGPVEYTFSGLPAADYEVALLFMEGCCSDGCVDEDLDGDLVPDHDPCDAVSDDDQAPLVDPQVASSACRVVDIYINDQLVKDQFSQNALAACLAGTAPGATSNCIAVSQVFTVDADGGTIKILVEDLGGGNPPENVSIKGISIKQVGECVPEQEICDNGRDDDCDGLVDGDDVDDCGGGGFIRGDSNADGSRNITDGVFIFSFLFTGGDAPPCRDSADTSDQGSINITSGIYILNHLFLGGPPPPAPFPECGPDPSADNLTCDEFPPCP